MSYSNSHVASPTAYTDVVYGGPIVQEEQTGGGVGGGGAAKSVVGRGQPDNRFRWEGRGPDREKGFSSGTERLGLLQILGTIQTTF